MFLSNFIIFRASRVAFPLKNRTNEIFSLLKFEGCNVQAAQSETGWLTRFFNPVTPLAQAALPDSQNTANTTVIIKSCKRKIKTLPFKYFATSDGAYDKGPLSIAFIFVIEFRVDDYNPEAVQHREHAGADEELRVGWKITQEQHGRVLVRTVRERARLS